MAMDRSVSSQIKSLIEAKISEKLQNYSAETEYKPFFEAIFNKETIALASIMQSLYTSFGMSIYEQMAIILSRGAGYGAQSQYDLLGSIDKETESLITQICNDRGRKPNKIEEIELIRKSIRPGSPKRDVEGRVDIFIVNKKQEEIYVDITTVKPNMKEFRALRKKMLRWCALRFSQKHGVKIKTYIGIPYNPYHPEKYGRWSACYDPAEDILVQEDLWECFAGYDVFDELIGVFKEAGQELHAKVSKFLK